MRYIFGPSSSVVSVTLSVILHAGGYTAGGGGGGGGGDITGFKPPPLWVRFFPLLVCLSEGSVMCEDTPTPCMKEKSVGSPDVQNNMHIFVNFV